MFRCLENLVVEVIVGRRKGGVFLILKSILLFFSWIYQLVSISRNFFYDKKILKQKRVTAFVISIGNIVAGGTGKTPLTLLLARMLRDFGKIAVISRGYRGKFEKSGRPVFLSKGMGPLLSAEEGGDEPFLLAKNLNGVFLLVGKNRIQAAQMACDTGVEMIILDDGMQHRSLFRDFDIVVMDAGSPFGYEHFLPRGFLRESPRALARADLIFVNHVVNKEQLREIEKRIRKYSLAPIVSARVIPDCVLKGNGEEVSIKNRRVGVFCAIAKPAYFSRTVNLLGAEVVQEYFLTDHDSFSSSKLEDFSLQCRSCEAELLVCTEKDWVKLEQKDHLSLPLAFVQMSLEIFSGKENWESFVKGLQQKLGS